GVLFSGANQGTQARDGGGRRHRRPSLTRVIRVPARTGSALPANAVYGAASLRSRLGRGEPGSRAPLRRGRRRTRRALGRRRARVLRRVHAVGARGEARPARGYHQEQDVHRPRAPSRVAGRGRGDGMEPLTLHDYTAAYALDALDRDEAERYEEHLATCEECQEQLARLGGAAGALAFAVESPA